MNTNQTTSGIGFTGILTICFIILKLTHVINWAWIWVLSPLWISGSLIILLLFILLLIAVTVTTKENRDDKR